MAAAAALLMGPGVSEAVAQGAVPASPSVLARPELDRPALPRFAPREDRSLPPPPKMAPVADRPGTVRFILRDIRLTGVTAVPVEEMRAIAAPHIGRATSAAELEDIRRALSEVYVRHGFINSGIVLPDQKVSDGVVIMRAVEGRLSAVDVRGVTRLEPDYVASRLSRRVGTPLAIDDLRESLEILLRDPVIRRVDARLEPGNRPGESLVGLTVEEQPLLGGGFTFSNSRSPAVGSYEGRGDLILRDVSGWGDVTSLRFARARGLTDAVGGFEMPLTPADTRLTINVEHTKSRVVEDPFGSLEIETQSTTVEAGLSQPIWRTASENLTVGVGVARRGVITRLLGDRFDFTSESENGVSETTAVRLTQNWTSRGTERVFAARSTFSFGVDWLGSTVKAGAPDSRFVAWLGQAQFAQRLGDGGAQMLVRTDAQFANDPLPGIEQYTLGGMATVRGYRENLLVRDNAIVASAEFRLPVAELALDDSSIPVGAGHPVGTIQLAAFADWGRGFNTGRDTPAPGSIASVGTGVLWKPTAWSEFQLYYGRALRKVDTGRDTTLEDKGVHFRLVVTP